MRAVPTRNGVLSVVEEEEEEEEEEVNRRSVEGFATPESGCQATDSRFWVTGLYTFTTTSAERERLRTRRGFVESGEICVQNYCSVTS